MTRKVYRRGRDGISPISQQNSSTELLGASEVFTGGADDIGDMSAAAVFINSSSPGTALFQVSADGTNWEDIREVNVRSDIAYSSELPLPAQYFRAVYTNGSIAQTSFILQVIFHDRAPQSTQADKPLAVRLSNGSGFETIDSLTYEIKQLRYAILASDIERKKTNHYLALIVGANPEEEIN